MAKKTISIAFLYGGVLAAKIMGSQKDITVPPKTPVDVPEKYGLQLKADGFAVDGAQFAAVDKDKGSYTLSAFAGLEKELAERETTLVDGQKQLVADQKTLVAAQTKLSTDQADLAAKLADADKAQKGADAYAKSLATVQANVVAARTALASADDAGKAAAQDALTKAEAAFAKVTA